MFALGRRIEAHTEPMTTLDTAAKQPFARARISAGIIATLAFTALAVQPLLGEGSYAYNLAAMLRFFTIWGNVGACCVMALIALGWSVSERRAQSTLAALATALAIIGGIYWGLLSGDHHPVGYDRITNQFHHTIIPIAMIVWWLRFAPPIRPIVSVVPAIMVPPLTYGAFALVLGQMTGFYAYFFVDLPALGWPQFLLNNLLLAGFFALVGMVLVALKNKLALYGTS